MMTSKKYYDLEGAIDDEWDLSNYCQTSRINNLKTRSEWVRDAFDKGDLTTKERNNLDDFVWKILLSFEENCVCKEYDPECDPGYGFSKS